MDFLSTDTRPFFTHKSLTFFNRWNRLFTHSNQTFLTPSSRDFYITENWLFFKHRKELFFFSSQTFLHLRKQTSCHRNWTFLTTWTRVFTTGIKGENHGPQLRWCQFFSQFFTRELLQQLQVCWADRPHRRLCASIFWPLRAISLYWWPDDGASEWKGHSMDLNLTSVTCCWVTASVIFSQSHWPRTELQGLHRWFELHPSTARCFFSVWCRQYEAHGPFEDPCLLL